MKRAYLKPKITIKNYNFINYTNTPDTISANILYRKGFKLNGSIVEFNEDELHS